MAGGQREFASPSPKLLPKGLWLKLNSKPPPILIHSPPRLNKWIPQIKQTEAPPSIICGHVASVGGVNKVEAGHRLDCAHPPGRGRTHMPPQRERPKRRGMEWGLPATVEELPPISGAGAIPEPLWAVAKQQWQAKVSKSKTSHAHHSMNLHDTCARTHKHFPT